MDPADQPDRPDPGADRADRSEPLRNQDLAVTTIAELFAFSQLEVPWPLGPPDGRYLLREGSDPETPSHVLTVRALDAPIRRRRRRALRHNDPQLEPEPHAVETCRATIIGVACPFPDEDAARDWLAHAGQAELGADLVILNRALHAYRVASADPYLGPVSQAQTVVCRVGFGTGQQLAGDGWSQARELARFERRRGRGALMLNPQVRFSAALSGRRPALACEELALRARLDLDHGRLREAALQLAIALDAALAELTDDTAVSALEGRLRELEELRAGVGAAARSALAGPLDALGGEVVAYALARLEAALRARSAAPD